MAAIYEHRVSKMDINEHVFNTNVVLDCVRGVFISERENYYENENVSCPLGQITISFV